MTREASDASQFLKPGSFRPGGRDGGNIVERITALENRMSAMEKRVGEFDLRLKKLNG
jgi:hypothetical protein